MEKVIIITGGSRGIGAATACLAAEHSYAVCVNYLRTERRHTALLVLLHRLEVERSRVAGLM